MRVAGFTVPEDDSLVAGLKHGSWWLEQQLRARIWIHKQEVES